MISVPIDKEKFEKVSIKLEEEIISFLKKRQEKAFTAEEIMGWTSFYVDFDVPGTSKIAMFMVANFVSVLQDLVNKGKISRKIVNNRMHFRASE